MSKKVVCDICGKDCTHGVTKAYISGYWKNGYQYGPWEYDFCFADAERVRALVDELREKHLNG